MSHMCVSSSVRAAFDLGFDSFVCHDACATRDLPDYKKKISADIIMLPRWQHCKIDLPL